jgi:hypothetical protein
MQKNGSGENISDNNVLGGINRRCKRGLSGETIENGFDFFAVPAGRANWRRFPSVHLRTATKEHEKISFRTSSSCDKGS